MASEARYRGFRSGFARNPLLKHLLKFLERTMKPGNNRRLIVIPALIRISSHDPTPTHVRQRVTELVSAASVGEPDIRKIEKRPKAPCTSGEAVAAADGRNQSNCAPSLFERSLKYKLWANDGKVHTDGERPERLSVAAEDTAASGCFSLPGNSLKMNFTGLGACTSWFCGIACS